MDWPKCEVCGGEKTIEININYRDPALRHQVHKCSACNGTGERDLTADEAADVLTTCQITFSWVDDGYYLTVWRGSNCIWSNEGAEVNSPTLTRALNAACRAVRSKG